MEMVEKTAERRSVTIGTLEQHGENVKVTINQEPKEDEKPVHRERKPVQKTVKININMAYTLCRHKPTNQKSRRHLQKHHDATKIKFRWEKKKDPVRTGSMPVKCCAISR